MNDTVRLESEKIIKTIDKLEKRVSDRFPNSNLRKICLQFLTIAQQSQHNIHWISRPNISLRFFSYLIILVGIAGLLYSITIIDFKIENTTLANVVTVSEAIFNDIILVGAAIFFLVSLESRLKTRKALKSLNELRVIAHVIDNASAYQRSLCK